MALDNPEASRHVSELPTARERFLARVLDQAFDDGWRTPEDFLRHFPPPAIVQSLANADALRVKLLVETTGAQERLALKKSVGSAGEDLSLALEEGLTTPAKVLSLYPPDDKVRHLPAEALWSFYVEDAFYALDAGSDPAAHARGVDRLTFVIEVALDEKLLTLKDVADGITFDEIAQDLPVEDLREVVKHALQLARANAPLTEERFHAVVPLSGLVSHVPLSHTWQRVVLEKVAMPAGFCAEAEAGPSGAGVGAPSLPIPTLASPSVAVPPPLPPPPPAARPRSNPPERAVAEPILAETDLQVPIEVDSSAMSAASPEVDEARRGVLERLTALERLPPGAESLPTPVLLSIESMYADLTGSPSDEEREAIIIEAFPNEAHLRTAMLALITLLDPSVNTTDPVIRDADAQSLVKLVVFEERKRAEPWRSSPGAVTPSPSSARRRSMPPPIPRSAPPPASVGEGRRGKRG
jgi:hypothetical protein